MTGKNMLVVAPFVPEINAPQAGHRLLYERIKSFSKYYNVDLFLIINKKEYLEKYDFMNDLCANVFLEKISLFDKIFALIFSNICFSPRFRTRLRGKTLRKLAGVINGGHYDVVNFEFSQVFPYSFLLKKKGLLDSKIWLSAHDVQTQVVSRKRFLEAFFFFYWTFLSEKILFSVADEVWTISEKDKNIIRFFLGFSGKINIFSVPMPGWMRLIDRKKSRESRKRIVVFWGAMNRIENESAVLWFLDNVWPKLIEFHPDLIFKVVGANPSKNLLKRASAKVIFTGFVENPAPYFSECACAVVPLFQGGGVKIKTLELINGRIPIFATDVALEGVDASSDLIKRVNSAGGFVDGLKTFFSL